MPVFYLPDQIDIFPHPELADQSGILAVGGGLEPERLKLAYSFGIFPWYGPDEPIIWWSPDPRMVLFPENLKVSKSMRPYFNQRKYQVTYNQAFENVITACCTANRNGQTGTGTWLVPEMIDAYKELNRLGIAHSVEVWNGDEMVGGLYGLILGKVFFGESMFSNQSNASKFGFISLVRKLQKENFLVIDCQQDTPHLRSMGADTISRSEFLEILAENRITMMQISPLRGQGVDF
jgi:leucyl/phenylalanyl-tRNA--protein transferase